MPVTVGVSMAHINDFDGVYFSIMSARLHQSHVSHTLVVDSGDDAVISHALKDLMNNAGGSYLPYTGPAGTSAPRDLAIRAQRTDVVICMDCHVLLLPGAVAAVQRYFEDPKNRKNILSGPLLFDSLNLVGAPTHFNPAWGPDLMWGKWGTTWIAPDGRLVSVSPTNDERTGIIHELRGDLQIVPVEGPPIPWVGHESVLHSAGYVPWLVENRNNPNATLRIPGQGLGCFAVWRENWPGFHEAAAGFGGEELCAHEWVRQNGGHAECLAGFMWVHRFFRPQQAAYPVLLWQKARNYALWFNRIGRSLDELDRFASRLGDDVWRAIKRDPVAYNGQATPQRLPNTRTGEFGPQPPSGLSLPDLTRWMIQTPRDFNEHILEVQRLAAAADSCAEFSGRRETTLALLACPGKIWVYNDETSDKIYNEYERLVREHVQSADRPKELTVVDNVGILRSTTMTLPEPVDLLLLDTEHSGSRIAKELDLHAGKVKRWIVIHDTTLYGENGQDGGLGMAPAIEFWVEKNPMWYVLSHTDRQYGLTILSCDPTTRPAQEITVGGRGGPGTELHRLLARMGIVPSPTCACRTRKSQMDNWGSIGCRTNFDTIVRWMEEARAEWGLNEGYDTNTTREMLALLTKGLTSWEGWKLGAQLLLNPTTPLLEIMVKIAISRAEKKGL